MDDRWEIAQGLAYAWRIGDPFPDWSMIGNELAVYQLVLDRYWMGRLEMVW